MIRVIEDYIRRLGMKISSAKSVCFKIAGTSKSFFIEDPALRCANGETIPARSAGEDLSYLGAKISPWKTPKIGPLKNEISEVLKRLKKLNHTKSSNCWKRISFLITFTHLPASPRLSCPSERSTRRSEQLQKTFFIWSNRVRTLPCMLPPRTVDLVSLVWNG